ncbi:MAG: hypothetical protein ACKVP0_07795 [Pirellulaceae bacterium]
MNSRVVGIIKFETPRLDSRGGDIGAGISASQDGLSLEQWLAALVGDSNKEHGSAPRWENRRSVAPSPRRVRANLSQLAEELDREYLELAAT